MNKPIILDGGMGTMLTAAGMQPGVHPSIFGMANPEVLKGIHRAYIEAGSRVILTNTFGANAKKLAESGLTVREVVSKNVNLAKVVAQEFALDGVKVALDIGPIGTLMEPYGELKFEEAYEIFREIIEAGSEADIIYFETMSSLSEVRAGVLAAKECSKLPVWATMSFEENGRTFIGTDAGSMALTLEGLGADALGVNCSLGPVEVLPIVKKIKEFTKLPIIVKPNAGLPDPETGGYKLGASDFAEQMKPFVEMGAYALGGCCGTSPEYIEKLAGVCEKFDGGVELQSETAKTSGKLSDTCGKSNSAGCDISNRSSYICSASKIVSLDGIKVVGERLNPTGKKRFRQALIDGDMNYVMSMAIEEEEAGADILDVNVGIPDVDEVALMTRVVKAVQSVSDLPLQIDSSNPEAVEAGLRVCEGRAIINSVDASDEKLAQILPLAKKYGAAVVGLAMDKGGLPKTADERVNYAKKIVETAKGYGISKKDVIIDCLALTISASQEQTRETLRAMERVRGELGLKLLLGVSNISFGLPNRGLINTTFLAQALSHGLNLPIINPNNKEMMDVISASRALLGEDASCEKYIEKYGAEAGAGSGAGSSESSGAGAQESAAGQAGDNLGGDKAGAQTHSSERGSDIGFAIRKGLKEETARIVGECLAGMDALTVVNSKLIPALDAVGKDYELGKLFLPQLISAASAAQAGFEVIRTAIAQAGEGAIEKGTIVLATVEGDIHDIGKNIVKVVLESYGYKVVDLGKDVPAEAVVTAVDEHHAKLVGLSALMTTTVPAMKKTIELVKKSSPDVKIMVGGAVLTKEYAEKIGADFYVNEATDDVRVAEEIFG